MFAGVNLHHFTSGPCAELLALAAARAQGARQMRCIVAVGDHGRGVLTGTDEVDVVTFVIRDKAEA